MHELITKDLVNNDHLGAFMSTFQYNLLLVSLFILCYVYGVLIYEISYDLVVFPSDVGRVGE